MSPRGFSSVRDASDELEARRGGGGPGALWFRLGDGEETIVRFLEQDDEIFWVYVHEVPIEGRQWGKDEICLNQENDNTPCPGCEQDVHRKFKGFMNLIWQDAPVWKRDAEGKMIKENDKPVQIGTKPQVAIWGSGIRLFEQLDEVNTNYRGLRSRRFKVKRKGQKLNTKYSIAPADVDGGPQPLDAQEAELAKGKYDLNEHTKSGTYADFLKVLGQVPNVGNGAAATPVEQAVRANPFMKKAS